MAFYGFMPFTQKFLLIITVCLEKVLITNANCIFLLIIKNILLSSLKFAYHSFGAINQSLFYFNRQSIRYTLKNYYETPRSLYPKGIPTS